MNKTVSRVWSALDGALQFQFTINLVPHDDVPTTVIVSSLLDQSPASEITITEKWPSQPFSFKYASGLYVSGFLQQKTPVYINGVPNTAIFADIHYGRVGRSEDHHVEGLIAACPLDGSRPFPAPPPAPEPVP